MTQDESFTIGELARRTGVSVETIRYYEKCGLLPEPVRTAGGHRQYREDSEARLMAVRECRFMEFGLDDIRDVLRLVDSGKYSCEEVKLIGIDQLKIVEERLAELSAHQDRLKGLIARCDGGASRNCAFLESLFPEVEQNV